MKETIGVITIGQAPRLDFTADLRTILSDQADVIEQGVLDGLSMDEIHALSPSPGNGETLLVSRLYNGEQVMLSKQKILPRIELIIHQMNETPIKMIILACTGEFPAFPSRVPVLYPDLILTHTVKGLLHEARDVDVVMPKEEQAAASAKKWNRLGLNVHPMICSPYEYTTSNMLMLLKITPEPRQSSLSLIAWVTLQQ
ncbi:AroM family protein [Geomicrobium sp. JCM 19039]|uniref:AroM family protein n=1 Tax=Geomicrobium sp. JCM 19039 TaxID=1460636 RepID=UPI00045F2A38|nr:AroM family protein [Geomicrobium sp. JCM 19039]GAK13931.1 AroM protein [Geomicrobium sp. JCM 19039]